jgi:FKBP-type peptidyl-prolyl cis-trans isomerase FkpA
MGVGAPAVGGGTAYTQSVAVARSHVPPDESSPTCGVVMNRPFSRALFAATLIIATPIALHAQSGRRVSLDTVQFAAALEVDLAASKRVTNGLHYRDIIVGTGPWAHRGTEITVRYVGALADGRAFTPLDEPPATFKLGAGTVIQGWDRGIVGMRSGGRRQLIIAPDLGYGGKQMGVIPPNSVLVFDIEIISVR